MSVDLARLRELAQAAPQGEWQSLGDGVCVAHGGDWIASTDDSEFEGAADYIAACSPDVVLALINAVEAARAMRSRLITAGGGLGLEAAIRTLDAALAPFAETGE